MLINLHVKNLALIEEAEVDFSSHLNIMTGETGAGKSILIGSIQSALGSKIPKDMIRHGSDSALIELIFHTKSKAVQEKMEELEIPFEDGDVIIQRRVTNHRVINKINDTSVTVSKLREISPLLLDLSGQHENQLLLKPENHQKILDSFASDKIKPLKDQVRQVFASYQKYLREYQEKRVSDADRNREMEFLKFEIAEIDRAQLKPGEDEELEAYYERAVHAKDILEGCSDAHELLSDGNVSAQEQLGDAIRQLESVRKYDQRIDGFLEQLGTIDALLNDFNRDLSDYMSEMEFDPETFHETETRLNLINDLKSKYGGDIFKILKYQEKSQQRLEQLTNYEEYLADLEANLKKSENELHKLSEKLTALRKEAAEPLAEKIRESLLDLNFNDVRFEIRFEKRNHYGAEGNDDICFMISTNPGMDVRPLHEIASGGELSRIMLAIKSILADEEQIETLIFDEIDTGISGRTAQKVSERLAMIARGRQVIAITHLPQIAAMAERHFLIEKTSDAQSTISQIHTLSEEESVEELARMLGGAKITKVVLENAREMKEFARSLR
ncbi:MAG: DNA repair protein RecN [Lachnospiraceae bacterium]|nr:DNA repair protein RecN [Lachnospiraceae bacterium]